VPVNGIAETSVVLPLLLSGAMDRWKPGQRNAYNAPIRQNDPDVLAGEPGLTRLTTFIVYDWPLMHAFTTLDFAFWFVSVSMKPRPFAEQ